MLEMELLEVIGHFGIKLDPQDPELPQDIKHHRGGFNVNNGVLAAVTVEGDCVLFHLPTFSDRPIDKEGMPIYIHSEWCETYAGGNFIVAALHKAGYERTGLWVPHSNDAGTWIRAHLPVTQRLLINQMVEAKRQRETDARLVRIAQIATP